MGQCRFGGGGGEIGTKGVRRGKLVVRPGSSPVEYIHVEFWGAWTQSNGIELW